MNNNSWHEMYVVVCNTPFHIHSLTQQEAIVGFWMYMKYCFCADTMYNYWLVLKFAS